MKGEGEGRGKERGGEGRGGASRFARIWSPILHAYNSETVRARPNMVHFSD